MSCGPLGCLLHGHFTPMLHIPAQAPPTTAPPFSPFPCYWTIWAQFPYSPAATHVLMSTPFPLPYAGVLSPLPPLHGPDRPHYTVPQWPTPPVARAVSGSWKTRESPETLAADAAGAMKGSSGWMRVQGHNLNPCGPRATSRTILV